MRAHSKYEEGKPFVQKIRLPVSTERHRTELLPPIWLPDRGFGLHTLRCISATPNLSLQIW